MVLFCVVQSFIQAVKNNLFVKFQVPMMTQNARNDAPPKIPQISMSEHRTPQFQVNSSFNNMMAQPAVCVIPSTMYNKEEHLGYLPENVEPSLHDVIKNNLTFLSGISSK